MKNLFFLIKGFALVAWYLVSDWRKFSYYARLLPNDGEMIVESSCPIVAVPFGSYTHGNPCQMNAIIAEAIDEIKSGNLVFTQEDISLGLNESKEVSVLYPKYSGQWVTTEEFFVWMKNEYPRGEIVIMGFIHHVRRIMMIAANMGYNPKIHKNSFGINQYSPNDQWWTVSPWIYIPWEYLSRLLLLGQGKI